MDELMYCYFQLLIAPLIHVFMEEHVSVYEEEEKISVYVNLGLEALPVMSVSIKLQKNSVEASVRLTQWALFYDE